MPLISEHPVRLAGLPSWSNAACTGLLVREKLRRPRTLYPRQRIVGNSGAPGVDLMPQSEASDAIILHPAPAPILQGLDFDAVQDVLTNKGLIAPVVGTGSPTAEGIPAVKSLVFIVQGQPLLLLLLVSDRVDVRKVATLLRTSKGQVRMASAKGVRDLTGFEIGAVPPFGHLQPIPTLVDCEVVKQGQVLTGSGVPACHLLLRPADLLIACGGRIVDIGFRLPGPASGSPAGDASGATVLPRPWPADAEAVRIVGRVASKRQMARLLAFVDLVPSTTPVLPQETAAVLRKLWRHPGSGEAARLQLIIGNTLERRLGPEPLAALIKDIKTGDRLVVIGRPQESPDGADRNDMMELVCHDISLLSDTPAQRSTGRGSGRAAGSYGRSLRRLGPELHALDDIAYPSYTLPDEQIEVADSLEALERMRRAIFDQRPASVSIAMDDARTQSAPGAEQQGGSFPVGLAPSQAFNQQMDLGSPNGPDLPGSSGVADLAPMQRSNVMSSNSLASGDRRGDALVPAQAGPAVGGDGLGNEAVGTESPEWLSSGDSAEEGAAMAGREGGGAVEVEGTAGVAETGRGVAEEGGMAEANGPLRVSEEGGADEGGGPLVRALAGQEGQSGGRPSGAAVWRVVGLDCEWEPCRHSGDMTPVSLLQVSTREMAFLIDMLWFCQPACYAATVEESTGAGALAEPLTDGQDGSVGEPRALTEREVALSEFLSDLFAAEDLVKLGFGLANDLERLCESYPHLPCFGGRLGQGNRQAESGPKAALPFRRHVDILLLAKAAMRAGTLGPWARPGLQRLCCAVLGSVLDKSQQRSQWQQRPLTAAQVSYAAADAHCLTAIFDALVGLLPEGIDSPEWQEHLSGQLDSLQRFVGKEQQRASAGSVGQGRSAGASPHSPRQDVERLEAGFLTGQPYRRPARQERREVVGPTAELEANVGGLLQHWLGTRMPEGGRGVVMQAALADEQGVLPTHYPRYPRGGGVIEWANVIMLFMNFDSWGRTNAYPNTFLEEGRKLTWYPSPHHSPHHPIIKRLLSTCELAAPQLDGKDRASSDASTVREPPTEVLLFCRLRQRGYLPFVFCGRLTAPTVDWDAAKCGVFVWTLEDFDKVQSSPEFAALVAAGSAASPALVGGLDEEGI